MSNPRVDDANPEPVGRHSRSYLWPRTDVIVLGNKDPDRGGIPGTFYRVPTNLEDWGPVVAAGGPGPIASGTVYDLTTGGEPAAAPEQPAAVRSKPWGYPAHDPVWQDVTRNHLAPPRCRCGDSECQMVDG